MTSVRDHVKPEGYTVALCDQVFQHLQSAIHRKILANLLYAKS